MKRYISIAIVLSMFLLCSCSSQKAVVFDSNRIDNGYNNFLAGGNMAYKDNNLYVNYISDDYITFGTYKFNNNGVSQVLSDENALGNYAFETPVFYQYDNRIYLIEDGVFVYDESEDKIADSEYNEMYEYISDTLKISRDAGKLTVKYKEDTEYTIEDVYQFYVYDNVIYIIDDDGWLYYNDVTQGNSKSTFLNYFTESYINFLHVCDDNVYFNVDEDECEGFETGLYCYSISDDNYELVLKGEINCLNSYDNVLYIATDKGIYKYESNEAVQITKRSAKEIYLLDEDWIYAVKNDAGNVYRISLDGERTETIDFFINSG